MLEVYYNEILLILRNERYVRVIVMFFRSISNQANTLNYNYSL